ncbi:pilin [Shewanella algicola]|uniref:Pilin n=2 Tax=Shewanella algicola TaxID=640633 RepID=A0A9X2CBW5_9GAMM|nr:pilin [Shewanella algicola]
MKTPIDHYVMTEGTFPANAAAANLTTPPAATGTLAINAASIAFTITKGTPSTKGKTITYARNPATGAWTCTSDLDATDKTKLMPTHCQG